LFAGVYDAFYGGGLRGSATKPDKGGANRASITNYDVVHPPKDVSTKDLRSAVALVGTEARSKEELKALCKALSEEFLERYPEYDAILIDIKDHGPEGKPVGRVAYFRAEWAERDFKSSTRTHYNVSC
jgi:hypothetical protein